MASLVVLLPLLVWAGWEFVRRYSGSWPRSYAIGLVGLPLASPLVARVLHPWGGAAGFVLPGAFVCFAALFYRLFISYPPTASRTHRGINRCALLGTALLAATPMVCLAWILMVSGLFWVHARDRNWLFWAITIPSLALSVFLIAASIRSFRRCSRMLGQA